MWSRVCLRQPWQPQSSGAWTNFTAQPLPSRGILGLVFMSLLPHSKSFQPDCLNLALLYDGKCAEAACKCHLPSNWWCQGPSKKSSTVAWNHSKSRWEADLCCKQGTALSSCWRTWFLLLNSLLAPDCRLLPIQGGTGLASWSPSQLGALKTKKQSLAKDPTMPNIARFLLLLLFLGCCFNLKGILRQTENQGLSVPF